MEDYRQSISHLEKMQRQGGAVTRSIAKEQGNLKKAASNMDAFNQENHEQRRAYDRAEKALQSIDLERGKLRQKAGDEGGGDA